MDRWTGTTAGPRLTAAAVAVGGMVLILGGQVIGNRHTVEGDLEGRSAAALQRAGLDTVAVGFSGRDARLAGPAGDLDHAAGVVRSLQGVRAVSTEEGPGVRPAPDQPVAATPAVRRSAAAPAPTVPPEDLRPLLPVSLIFEGRTITVTGEVPSRKAADRTISTVRQAAASVSWKVTARLQVQPWIDARARPEFWTGLRTLVRAVPTDGDRLVVRFGDDRVTLRGHPRDRELENSLLEAAKTTVIPPYWVQDGLDVRH